MNILDLDLRFKCSDSTDDHRQIQYSYSYGYGNLIHLKVTKQMSQQIDPQNKFIQNDLRSCLKKKKKKWV